MTSSDTTPARLRVLWGMRLMAAGLVGWLAWVHYERRFGWFGVRQIAGCRGVGFGFRRQGGVRRFGGHGLQFGIVGGIDFRLIAEDALNAIEDGTGFMEPVLSENDDNAPAELLQNRGLGEVTFDEVRIGVMGFRIEEDAELVIGIVFRAHGEVAAKA